jgi:hypothetical protein
MSHIFFQVDKEKVATIIAQALKKQETASGGSDETRSTTNLPANSVSSDAVDSSSEAAMELVSVEMEIQFERADKGLGLSIAGGLGSTPYKNNDEGIFISRVTPMGPADIAGLRKDDKVLSVNNHSCVNIDHYVAVDILKASGEFIRMKIVREVSFACSLLWKKLIFNFYFKVFVDKRRGGQGRVTSATESLSSLSQAGSNSQKSLANNRSNSGTLQLPMVIHKCLNNF